MSRLDIPGYLSAFSELIRAAGNSEELVDRDFCQEIQKVGACLGIFKAELMVIGYSFPENIVIFETEGGCNLAHTKVVENVRFIAKKQVHTILYLQNSPGNGQTEEIEAGIRNLIEIIEIQAAKALNRRNENELKRTDSVTEVATAEYFYEYADKLFKSGEIADYAACSFTLKGMEEINRKLDAHSGNMLMKTYVKRLQELIGKFGIVARNSGINFSAIFLKDKANEVMDYLAGQDIYLPELDVSRFMSAYAGYFLSAENSQSPMELNDVLNIAIQTARENAGSPYIIYDDKLRQQINDAKYIESIFQGALQEEEFFVYYQPKVETKSYLLAGAEALCRWKHDGEMILPFRFIPVLEQNGEICRLDFYMLEHVCRDMRRWIDGGGKAVRVSVNLSRLHMGNPNLLKNILEIIDSYDIPHQYIEIELTETTTEVDYIELKKLVSGLRDAGIFTSVDDFGVGYSSMNLLRELPWNIIKIDRSFMPIGDNSQEDEKRKVMLKSVIGMTQALGLKCIAEGVETVDQIILLKKYGCYFVQGYYFDKPLPVEEFETRLLQESQNDF
ncbi:MAG TPA: GGDEF domain-containing protein [Lachnospiraceae bacterium]|nr:GGDEF domain-containing protein [Lachnospiraceae bacterium]